MHLASYPYIIRDNSLDFEFTSVGPRGKIKKVIRFSPFHSDDRIFFNLGLGDYDPVTGKIDYHVRTDNKDREKVLATVAACVLRFTEIFPTAVVYAIGATPARSRLYQMAILANWDDICVYLHIYGRRPPRKWERFRPNIAYEAFLASRDIL